MINLIEYKNRQEIIKLLAECMYLDEERVKREYEQYNNDQTRILFGKIKNNEFSRNFRCYLVIEVRS